jgi:hypothetical protein
VLGHDGGVETSGYFGDDQPIERASVALMGELERRRDDSDLPDVPSQAAKARLNQWARGSGSALLPGWGTRRDIPASLEERPRC